MHKAKHLNQVSNRAAAHTTIGNPHMLHATCMVAEKIGIMCDDDAPLIARVFKMRQIVRSAQSSIDAGRHIDTSPTQRDGDERWNVLV